MSTNDPLTPESQPGAPIVAENDAKLERTLEHARKGHGNAQDVIKLVDAKNSVFIGLSTLAAGFVFALLKWSLELPADRGNLGTFLSAYPGSRLWLLLPVGVTLIAALLCIGFCVWSTIARARPENLHHKVTVLFPAYPKPSTEIAHEYFQISLRDGMTEAEVLAEYEDQLRVLGMILGQKLRFHRWAALTFLVQLCTVAVVFVLFLFSSLATFSRPAPTLRAATPPALSSPTPSVAPAPPAP